MCRKSLTLNRSYVRKYDGGGNKKTESLYQTGFIGYIGSGDLILPRISKRRGGALRTFAALS